MTDWRSRALNLLRVRQIIARKNLLEHNLCLFPKTFSLNMAVPNGERRQGRAWSAAGMNDISCQLRCVALAVLV